MWIRWVSGLVLCGVLATVTPPVSALPATITAIDVVDDATVSLVTWEQYIEGDARTRCEVSVVVLGNEVQFTQGDSVQVWVEENDIFRNDPMWQTEFNVTEEEVEAQRVERQFDCSASIPSDLVSWPEVVALAEVVKEQCGFFCLYDRPATSDIQIEPQTDDAAEEDDHSGVSVFVMSGHIENRLNRDQDWFEFTLADRGNVTLGAVHDGRYGRLDVALFNADNERIAEGDDLPEQTVLQGRDLAGGTYRARVSPRQSNDFNFYDVRLILDSFEDSCDPGVEDVRPCGDCGSQRRQCGDNQHWGPFGDCEEQGECAPGDERRVACDDRCGTLQEFCTEVCSWHRPSEACQSSGVCSLGETETRECEAGIEFRACDERCLWSEWSNCSARECEEGDMRTCYDGPDGSVGVGICREGRQRCENGLWNQCSAQITPSVELCADDRDNDCDGKRDDEDPECQYEGAELGSACLHTRECLGDLLCLGPPQNPQFVDGYCGDDDCSSDLDCGAEGVCANIFGANYCLRICDDIGDCRRGYLCALVVPEIRACAPRCTVDDDCTDAEAPVCDLTSGLCTQEPAANNGADAGDGPNNIQSDTGDSDVGGALGDQAEGCACEVTGRPSWISWRRR